MDEIQERLIREALALDKDSRKELREVLTSRALRSALKEILEEMDITNTLVGLNLTTSEGVALANSRQGRAEGMARALDIIFELSQEAEDELQTES